MKKEFVKQIKRISNYNLVQSSSGNISWRFNPQFRRNIYITSSGSWFENLIEDDVVQMDIFFDELALNEKKKPSSEYEFHCGIMKARGDVNVILHCQSSYATAISCYKKKINFNVIPEIPYYCKEIAYVPYIKPGTKELAKKVIEKSHKHDIIILKNHGQIIMGRDFDDVLQKALFLELASKIIVTSNEKLNFINFD